MHQCFHQTEEDFSPLTPALPPHPYLILRRSFAVALSLHLQAGQLQLIHCIASVHPPGKSKRSKGWTFSHSRVNSLTGWTCVSLSVSKVT